MMQRTSMLRAAIVLSMGMTVACADAPMDPSPDVEGASAVGPANDLSSATVFLSDLVHHQIVVADTRTDRIVNRVDADRPKASAATPDRGTVVVVDGSTVRVFDGRTGRTEGTIDLPWGGDAIAVHPDGAFAYVVARTRPFLAVLDVEARAVSETVFVPYRYVSAVEFSRSGDRAYMAAQLVDDVIVIETDDHSVAGSIDLGVYEAEPDRGHDPRDLVVSPDGSRLYVANEASGSLAVVDTETESLVATIAGVADPYWTRNLDVSRDGEEVYVADFRNGVTVVDTETLSVAKTIDFPTTGAFGVAATPDNTQVYVSNYVLSQGFKVIDRETNEIAETRDLAGASNMTIVPRRPRAGRGRR